MHDYKEVINEIVAEKKSKKYFPLILNLCDGDEINGTPGVSVLKYLDEKDLIYTGADEYFYQVTTSKISMKEAFDDAIKAQEDEKRFRGQAQAYEARVVPIAEGNAKRIFAEAKAYAEQVVLRATGEAAEFLALLPEYTRSPGVTGERMYLDTMQQILSRSSKIVVDGKAGNMLYLPLDKLMTTSPQPDLTKNQVVNRDNLANQDGNSNGLFDGRETIRPTERQGRTN